MLMLGRLARDPWSQAFAFIALACAFLQAQSRVGRAPLSLPGLLAPSEVKEAPLPAGGAAALQAKNPGRWIVGATPDADSPDFAAVVASAKEGDTILLRPGLHETGTAVIAKSLAILGDGEKSEDTVLEGPAEAPVAVTAGKVSFKNLTLSYSGTNPSGSLLVDRAAVELSNVRITAAAESNGAVVLKGSLSAVNSVFEGGANGVIAKAGAHVRLERCTLRKHGISLVLEGEGVRGSFTSIKISDSKAGLQLADRAEAEVENSVFEAGEAGAYVEKRARLRMSRSTVADVDFGVSLAAGSWGRFSQVLFSKNKVGLAVRDESEAVVEACQFKGNRSTALWIREFGSKAKVTGSDLSDNLEALRVEELASAEVYDSTIYNNRKTAVGVLSGAEAALVRTAVLRNGESGVALDRRAKLRMSKSYIRQSGSTGLVLHEEAAAVLNEAQIYENATAGVMLSRDASLTAVQTDVNDNKLCGLLINGGAVTLSKSRVNRNACAAMFLEGGGSLKANGNDFTKNKSGPLIYQDRQKVILEGIGNTPKLF
jgi:hypothetical protein